MKVAILVRKPIEGTVAGSAIQYGTGGLNIDASRCDGKWPKNSIGETSNRPESPVSHATTMKAVLWQGDCFDRLKSVPPIQAVITDPPYGIGFRPRVGHFG